MKIQLAVILAVAVGLIVPLQAVAQEADTAQSDAVAEGSDGPTLSEIEPAEGVTNDTLDDEKIDSFIQAVSMIGRVSANYASLVEEEEDEARRAFLIDTANKDIVRAIDTAPNITPSEFVAIDQASQADPVLSDRILARIEVLKQEAKDNQPLRLPEPEPKE